MATTIVFLVRHAKAADRFEWTGGDRDRPLIDKGRRQADRLAAALRREQPVLVAASPWLRCRQTAAPLASAMGLQVELDDRLGYDAPDVAAWVRAAVRDHPGQAVVAVSQAADSDTVQASGRPPAFEIVTDAAVPVVPKSTSSGETASRAGDATTTDSATVR